MPTYQEMNWIDTFGDNYHARSPGDVEANLDFFEPILTQVPVSNSILEFGAGTGANLMALRQLYEDWGETCRLCALEINGKAVQKLEKLGLERIYRQSILEFDVSVPAWDVVFTKGLLIHVAPQNWPRAFQSLYRASKRHILIAEYFSKVPREIMYQGEAQMLWTGPHAYAMMDQYPDLKIVDYGFRSSRDEFPQDDLTWFLLSKGD